MPQKYEIVSFTEENPVRCTMERLGVIDTHLHDFFEIDLILTGKCHVSIGEQVYSLQADDVLSIEGHTPHSFRGTDCTMICVKFDQSLFERMLPEPEHPRFLCNSAEQGDNAAFDRLRRLIARIVKNNADRQVGYPLRNWSLIYDLMDVMYNNFRVEDTTAHTQRAYRYTERMAEINRIVSESYRDDLTLSMLADRVHLSAPYLSKFFDKHFGVTFLAYLTRVRLGHAVVELLKTDDTIETISASSGFPNSHAFVQAFKKEYGVLPSIYRRQARSQETQDSPLPQVEQHDYMAGLKKYLDIPAADLPSTQAITCSAAFSARDEVKTLTHTWRNVLTVTSAQALLLSDVQDMLRRVQREVGFRYVKFNGILSEEMHIYSENANGEAVYSFAYVDKVCDFLLSIGLRPMIQLSFMPEALAKEKRRLFSYLVSEPVSREKWAALVSALIRHLRERYGAEETRQWLFSVWDQPDTPVSMYGFSSDEAFYAFYEATWHAVKGADPALRFGTPATYYILREGHTNWYLPFLAWCREHGCMPDFLNFHYYDTTLSDTVETGREAFGFTHAMTLQENPNGFGDFITQVLSERSREGLDALPIYLTEWNSNPSQQDLMNDTCYKSCYIAKGIAENYDRLDSFGYWSLTDWMGEAPQPKEMFFGGLGMFTAGGLPKASYYVFTLLRRLGDTLVGRGQGWLATKQGGSFQVLLYNYRHFSHLYALGERFDMTFHDRYTPFSPEQLLDAHITIRDVPGPSYLVTETYISRRSGSAYDIWNATGGVELTKPSELENLACRSVPSFNKYFLTAENSTLELDAMLEMLEVRLIVIEPVP